MGQGYRLRHREVDARFHLWLWWPLLFSRLNAMVPPGSGDFEVREYVQENSAGKASGTVS